MLLLKKTFKILLTIFLIFAIVAGAVMVWQWKNIKSITLGVRENSEQIERRRNENQEKLVEDVNVFMDTPLRGITEEEKARIENGETTLNEVYQKIFEEKIKEADKNETKQPETEAVESVAEEKTSSEKEEKPAIKEKENTPSNKKEPSKKGEMQDTKPKEQQTKTKETKDQIISRYMVELYKLQNEFNSKAEATVKAGGRYYESIKTHEHDAAARAETIRQYTSVVRSVESECDARVEELVKNLEAELIAIGADTAIIETIRATYANEKQLKLSYYANKYLK